MPPYGSTTRGPQRTKNSVGLGEQQAGTAGGTVRVPHVAVGRLGADEEPGTVGRLAVDPVELPEAVALGIDHDHAARLCLVDVLAPLLAQVAPQRLLVGAEVDDPA
jgi:hypothetical protein